VIASGTGDRVSEGSRLAETARGFGYTRSGRPATPSVPTRNAEQTSRGKFSRLPCAVAESTLRVLDEYGLCDSLPARPTLAPHIRFLSINSHICSALPSDPASRR
jgi:hypothetical protein